MATGGHTGFSWSLVNVGHLTLGNTNSDYDYRGIVVSGDMIMVTDHNACNIQLYRRQDGHLLAVSHRLESQPCGICAVNDMEICALLNNSAIKIMLIRCTRGTWNIIPVRTVYIQPSIDNLHGVVTLINNVLVFGENEGTLSLCIVSPNDGNTDKIHQICKGYHYRISHLATRNNMIYIARYAGSDYPDIGVYAYDIQNPSTRKFIYTHNDLKNPSGITVDTRGFIFVCNNHPVLPPCIHHLTSQCQLVTIYSGEIPWNPNDLFWDQQNGHLYVTSRMSNMISRCKPVYYDRQEEVSGRQPTSLLRRLKRSFGIDSLQNKNANKHSQGYKNNDETKQPVCEETSTEIDQGVVELRVKGDSLAQRSGCRNAIYIERTQSLVGNVDTGHSSLAIEASPSVQVAKDSVDDKTGTAIPMEILRMDDKSIELYKDALRDGKEKAYNIRIMVVGPYGVGKTALTKRLLGHQVDMLDRKSTEGIDIYKHSCKISLDTGEWIEQHKDVEQLSRLQRLLKLLTGQTETPEDRREKKEHTLVIYENETNPKRLHSPVYINIKDADDDTSSSRELIVQNDPSNSKESDADVMVHTYVNQPKKTFSIPLDQRHQAPKACGVSIQESGRQEPATGDATMEFFQLAIKQADKLDTSRGDYATLEMWDFAGQYIFYTTHQTFLTDRAIYLLVTDLSQQVTDLVKDDECFFDTEGRKLCKVQDLVEVWFNSIHSFSPSSSAVTAVASSDVSIPSTPPVILVGTHADTIGEDKRHKVINRYFQQICYILKDKPCLQHLSGCFAIDNTQCDPQLETMKQHILQLAKKQPYWGKEIPANWLPLEDALMKLRSSGTKVIPIRVVEEVNNGAAVPIKTAEQLDLFLRFQHQTGNILFFGVDGLREKIVLDPQWLIDALKSLITAETFIKKYPAFTSKWYEFDETGILTHEIIDAIWTEKDHKEFHDNKDHILLLMEKLNIIARPRSFTEEGKEAKEDNYFLAPCMLKRTAPLEVTCPKPNDQMGSSSVFCFVFMGKFMPTPIFHRLLAACIGLWPIATKKKEKKQENQIFCGCCVFQLDQHHKLTLYFREYVIFVRVTRMGIRENTPSSKLCIEVREFITTVLIEIIGYLGQGLKFEQFIQCPEYSGESVNSLIPVSLLKENLEVCCDFHGNVIESCKLLTFWFHDEEQSEEVDASTASPMPSPPASDTDRFMCIAYLLNDVGSKVLRKLFHHMVITPTCTLDQHLANNKSTIDNLLKKRVLNPSQMDIMFPPNGDDTNLDEYDITLLSALFNNIVPSLGQKELNLVKGLRDDRNKLYGHTKSCTMNANDFQTCWSNISSTLITLSQQCRDPNFENEMLKEIQQTRVPDASYLSILQAWFSRIERVEQRLKSSETSPTSETEA